MANCSFSEIERLFMGVGLRLADGSYTVQPHAWAKYGRGARSVIENNDKGIPVRVAWAEQHFPGSSLSYTSLLWDVLDKRNKNLIFPDRRDVDLSKLNKKLLEQLDDLVVELTSVRSRIAASIPDLDAFAVLLLGLNADFRGRVDPERVGLAARWMSNWALKIPGLVEAEAMFSRLVFEEFPLLRQAWESSLQSA
jgi:hypothetical protein